jgi:type II secretory pathway component PulC
MDYYAELRDEPERLVKIFDSMKPVYSQDRKITGYQLGIEGEADFFASTGLQQGDVVTSVNSMEMTSRNRAEYFIKEFIADRANAFVLDVQRGGNPLKLMYEVR